MNNNTPQDLSPNLLSFIWKYFASSDGDTLVIRKSLIDICGSHTSALMVSQVLYWHNKYGAMERFMKISYEDWYDQVRLSSKQVKTCLKKLKALDLIETIHKRFNGLKCLHIRIKFETLTQLLMAYDPSHPPPSPGKKEVATDAQITSPCDAVINERDNSEKPNIDGASKPLAVENGVQLSTARSGPFAPTGRVKRARRITKNTTQNTKDNNAHLEKGRCATLPTHENTFKEFWDVYPKKKNKKRAFKIWKDKNLRVIAKEIIEKVTQQREKDKKWSKMQYIPYPTTYLENERWTEEIIPATPLFQHSRDKSMKLEGIVLEYQNYVQDLKAQIRLKLVSPDIPILEFNQWKERIYNGKPNDRGNGKMVE